ncbi:MAG TPA: lysylphosphatidylglycerol synthase domain-containing protein [Solirubrobacterales bacterium]|nr:lysylphosphatidylglycerol synthase domain-containing protein [Solirubrobacterales bacterium]
MLTYRVPPGPASGGHDVAVLATEAEEVVEKTRLRRNLTIAGLAAIGLAVAVGLNFSEVVEGLSQISPAEAFALVALHLLALVLRAISWGVCLDAAGRPVPARELHITSGPRFLADTVVPTYVGAFVRVGLIRMIMESRAPTIGQMVAADGVILLVEGVITVVAVLALTLTVGLPLWWSAVVIGLSGAGALLALWLKRRYADREFVRALDILATRQKLVALVALLTVVLVVQPIRFWIAINGVGIDADFIQAVLAFLATSVIGGLPVGPGPASVGATGVVFSGEELGLIAAAGIGLTATAFVAALVYTLAGLAVAAPSARVALVSWLRRVAPSTPGGADTPR